MVAKGDKVYRFHSFLRVSSKKSRDSSFEVISNLLPSKILAVSYDTLFQGKWDIKAKMMNKFNKNKPMMEQLTYPQLYYVCEIAKSLENKKVLSLLNIESLKYRKKLKFPNNKINYKNNPEYYLYTSNEKGALEIEPYKTLIYEFADNSNKLFELFFFI
jgi:hypothetical protein